MTVDLSKIRPGDELLFRAVAAPPLAYDCEFGRVISATLSNGTHHGLPVNAIVSHTPKALAVGDRVTRCRFGHTRGTIKHVIDGRAWVDWSSGQQLIHQLTDLERVDD